MLVAYNLPPSPTAFNQLVACALWAVALIAARPGRTARGGIAPAPGDIRAPLAAMAIVAACAAWAMLRLGLPASIGLAAMATLTLAASCMVLGSWLRRTDADDAIVGIAWGLVVAGAASTAIALVQFALPEWADGDVIARSALAGRSVGNLRQPNHLATLMLLASIAVVALAARASWPMFAAAAFFAWMILGVTLAASRTGVAGTVVLAAWGLADRRLATHWRWLLAAAPLMLAAFWSILDLASARSIGSFAGASRLQGADISASRFGIWRDALALVAADPLTGVGFGRFNLAWTTLESPSRPRALFDHTHNLPLQFVAELGLPLGLLVCTLLGVALWQAWQRSWPTAEHDSPLVRGLFVIVVMMVIHSQLEYPLWYAHFLLPAAFALGACLGVKGGRDDAWDTPTAARTRFGKVIPAVGLIAVVATAYGALDYVRVGSIFATGTHASSLEQRIADGRRSLFFAHHAEYARATTAANPGEAMDSIDIAKYNLLDTRLMLAWARAHAEQGDLERARYVADRLREFGNPASRAFFAACEGDPQPRPFQCDPSTLRFTWRDFAGREAPSAHR
jgi:O-antigen ligase